jgi:hypothetical protein
MGRTLWHDVKDRYMGLYPQLEIDHDIPIEQVEKIMVPEHLWAEAEELARQNPKIAGLLCKIEGTGATKQEFVRGRNYLGRRTRYLGGSFQPNFGYNSFFLFEQAYFKIVLGEFKEFKSKASALIEKYGFQVLAARGWIWATPPPEESIERNDSDWKIFVNPREEKYFEVLEAVLKTLRGKGVHFKIPPDLLDEWRAGRKFGSSSSAPKIIVYVNEKTLVPILTALNFVFAKSLKDAGFGEDSGPSFSKRFGISDLLLYKREYGYDGSGDERAGIADGAGEEMEKKRAALAAAGFAGENFYIKKGEFDPVSNVELLDGLSKQDREALKQGIGILKMRGRKFIVKRDGMILVYSFSERVSGKPGLLKIGDREFKREEFLSEFNYLKLPDGANIFDEKTDGIEIRVHGYDIRLSSPLPDK